MDPNTKVHFTLGIGFHRANHKEEFTLKQLGYNPNFDKDLEAFLNQQWKEWSTNYIDGSWSFEEEDI